MGRKRPAIIAPRAGRFINIPVRLSRASARTARSRAITPGSISTTPSASARMCRCPPANLHDGLVALKDGKMILLRVPYPLGFYAKGFDGRIDDPKAGWKGRGLWSSSGDRAPWLMEKRQRLQADGRAFSVAARSVGEITQSPFNPRELDPRTAQRRSLHAVKAPSFFHGPFHQR